MKLKRLKFRNINAYGNKWQEINFNTDNLFYLLLGKNGAGKSTCAVALKFGLYGKVDGINLSDIPNRTNKAAEVIIEWEYKGKHLRLERGYKPSFLNFYEDGQIPKLPANKTDIQNYIESRYIKIPFNVFVNSIILSVNDFKSFISLSASDKRKIIDRLFGFEDINSIREHINSDISILNKEKTNLSFKLQNTNDAIIKVEEQILELAKESDAKNKEEIKKLKKSLTEIKSSLESYNNDIKKLDEAEFKVLKNEGDYQYDYAMHNSEIKQCKNSLSLYDKGKCPTCGSDFHTPEFEKKKDELKNKISKSEDIVNKCKDELDKIYNKVNKIKEIKSKISKQMDSLEYRFNQEKEQLVELANIKSPKSDKLLEFKNEYEKVLNEGKEHDKILSGKIKYLSLLHDDIFNEKTGIKKLAMEKIMPYLNSTIHDYAKEISLPFNFYFDNNFNCNILQFGNEVNYKTLSVGERKKADFITLIALIKLIKMKYPNLNIMFLDEIFSSIDNEGIYDIIKILKNAIKEIGLNTFVINHSPLPEELFDKILIAVKTGGYSKLVDTRG